MAGDPTCSAVLVGHVFVRRLGVYAVEHKILNLRLDIKQFPVELRGKGGLCLKYDANIVQFQKIPDICGGSLQIGKNDITASRKRCFKNRTKDSVSLASNLHEGVGVRRLFI